MVVVASLVAYTACGDDGPSGSGAAATCNVGGSGATGSGATGSGANGGSGAGGAGASGGTGGTGAAGSSGTGASGPTFSNSVITEHHRFIPGAMFGGWGPHLGHLVRAGGSLYFVDDVCTQMPGSAIYPPCDVNDDHTLAVFEWIDGTWQSIATMAPPGVVQQNTATIASADGTKLHTFGIGVPVGAGGSGAVVECTFTIATGASSCVALNIATGPSANYVGAAVSPQGYRMVWWTGVVDGGGGSFHFIVDYGGGWNGPRSGGVAGFNDSSYINIAFEPNGSAFTMHTQLVGGLAPNWTFHGATGEGDLAVDAAVSWATNLGPVEGDPIASTNDIWIDPDGDTHLLARSAAGKLVYFYRPVGGAFAATFWRESTFRGRFVPFGDKLLIALGPAGAGLELLLASAEDVSASAPIDWANKTPIAVQLPAGFESLMAIYPAAPPYFLEPSSDVDVVVIGTPKENEALHVHVQGL